MAYKKKVFYTEDGPQVFEFDYIPPEPTAAQLAQFVPHTCQWCEWRNICQQANRLAEQQCDRWEMSIDAFSTAELEYYKNLHKERYG